MARTKINNEVVYEPNKVFKPLEWQVKPWASKAPVLVLSGAAGGGKSRFAAEKLHAFMLKYPNSTGLIVRKTRSSLINSSLLMIQRQVIGDDPRVVHKPASYRFEYSNGSVLAYGGMKDNDQREAIRSIGQDGGLDIAWMEEANQFTESDVNELIARMRGKAADWTQLLITTNPDGPLHWIYVNYILPATAGEAEHVDYFASSAYDNPFNSKDYITRNLETLTGVQRERLLYGRWVQSSGIIFDSWVDDWDSDKTKKRDSNVTEDAIFIPGGGSVLWFVDDGMSGKRKNGRWTANSHPRAILMAQIRHDGRVAVFKESLRAGILADQHISDLLDECDEMGWPYPSYVIHDRAAASFRIALKEFALVSKFNTMRVEESIKEAMKFISPDRDGVRRLIVHPSCVDLRYEFKMYARRGNKIIKQHDHAIDALRYGLWQLAHGRAGNSDVATYDDVLDIEKLKELYDTPRKRYGRSGIDIAVY